MPEDNQATTPRSPQTVETTPRQMRLLYQLVLVGAIAGSLTVASYIFLYVQTQAWQILVAALGVAAGTVCLLPVWRQLRRHDVERAGYWFLAVIILAFGPAEAVWANNTLFALGGVLLLMALLGNLIRPQRPRIWVGVAIGFTAYVILINLIQPFPRYDISQLPALRLFVPIAVGGLFIILFWQTARVYATYALRTKLLVALMAVSLIPLGLVVIASNYVFRQSALEAADKLLLSGATKVVDEIDDLITQNLKGIDAEAQLPVLARYLALPNDQRSGSAEEAELTNILQTLARRDEDNIMSYALLDARGTTVFDTSNSAASGLDESGQDYFQRPFTTGQSFVSDVRFSADHPDEAGFYFSSPVRDSTRQPVGVLRVLYKADALQKIVEESSGLTGEESFGVLFDENHIRIADGEDPDLNFTSIVPLDPARVAQLQAAGRLPDRPADQLTVNLPDFETVLQNAETQPYFVGSPHPDPVPDQGVVAKLKTRNWLMVFLQTQSIFLAGSDRQSLAALIFALINVAGVVFAAFIVTRVIVRPITQLTTVTQRVTAGDLTAQAPVETNDEIGTLATTFNIMTLRLRDTIGSLETRVAANTEQLRASADVGRTAVAVLDPDELLDRVVNLITQRFGFYYAAVFTKDAQNRHAILREATGEAGRMLKAQGHQLEIGGQSMVGQAMARRRPRIALDTGEEAVRFANPLLPDTRSEIALPLVAGDQVLGALDVQSTAEAAFDESSAAVLQSMADQIAVALSNAEQFTQAAVALQRAENLSESILTMVDAKSIREVVQLLARYANNMVAANRTAVYLVDHDLKQVSAQAVAGDNGDLETLKYEDLNSGISGLVFRSGQPVLSLSADDGIEPAETAERRRQNGTGALVVVPLVAQGRVIGTVTVSNLSSQRPFTRQDVDLCMTLAAQSVSVIERLRLFEQAQRALSDLDTINRQLTGAGWEKFARRRSQSNYIWVTRSDQLQPSGGVGPSGAVGPQPLPEVTEALTLGHVATRLLDDGVQLGVAVPIKLRDVPIGTLRMIVPLPAWTSELSASLESIATHVAQAAENARLITESEERLARERALTEATEKVRQRNDIDSILETAAAELARYLNANRIAVRLTAPGETVALGEKSALGEKATLDDRAAGNGQAA